MRTCSGCTLCCRLLPVTELHKGANERCPHQRFRTGCAIYKRRPRTCQLWSCRWLIGDDTTDMNRPDRVGYVIDTLPDFIKVNGVPFEVVQIWADPRRHDAWRKDPRLLAFIERRALEGKLALIRLDAVRAVTLLAPSISPAQDGQWLEINGGRVEENHSAAEIAATLGMGAVSSAAERLLAHAAGIADG